MVKRAADAILHPGCSAGVDRTAQWALVALAARADMHVVLAPERCCGALARHAGDTQLAEQLAEQLAADHAWQSDTPVPQLIWASGCLRHCQQSLHCPSTARDVLSWSVETLAERLPKLKWQDCKRIALHVPCTQSTMGDGNASRALLAKVLGIDLIPLRGMGCCGAAGMRFLASEHVCEPTSDSLLDAAAAHGASILLSSNPGCLTLLRGRAQERNMPIRVEHVFTFLASLYGDPACPV